MTPKRPRLCHASTTLLAAERLSPRCYAGEAKAVHSRPAQLLTPCWPVRHTAAFFRFLYAQTGLVATYRDRARVAVLSLPVERTHKEIPMRLTLRTLLACRDGLLDGAEAEELSAKVTDGSVARGLLERMSALGKRADIEVPKLDGRGLAVDANSVAEYLENRLEAEKLEAFERICLESDRHLAEVSECHALLADPPAGQGAGGDSAKLISRIAARLAGGVPEGLPRQPEPPQSRRKPTPHEPPAAVQVRLAAEPTEAVKSRRSRTAVQKSSPWLQIAMAVGLLCLSGGGLGLVLWRNPGVSEPPAATEQVAHQPEDPALIDGATASPPRPAAAELPQQPEGQAADQQTVASGPLLGPVQELAADADAAEGEGESAGTIEIAESSESTESLPDEANAAAPPSAPEPPLGVGPNVPMGDALAIAAPLAPGPDAILPPATAPEPPAIDPLPTRSQGTATLGVVSQGPFLLMSDLDPPGTWRSVFPGDSLPPEIRLLVPPASQPELELEDTVVRVAPRSQLVLRQTDSEQGQRTEIELVFGRAVIRRTTGTASVMLRAGGLHGQLAGPPAAAVLQVDVLRPAGGDPESDAGVFASLNAIEGPLTWVPAAGSPPLLDMADNGVLAEGMSVRWSSRSPAEAAVGSAKDDFLQSFSPIPDRLQATAVASLARSLRNQEDALGTVRQFAFSSRVERREVAAGTLALIGDYGTAVQLLCEEAVGARLGESRWRAFEQDVVPLALARGIHSAERLRQTLVQQLGKDEGQRVFQLASGLTDGQLAEGGAAALVAALNDPRLVIRRYAVLRLEEILLPSPREQLRYRADAAAELRAEGARWWAVQLEKGLIQRSNVRQLSGPDAG